MRIVRGAVLGCLCLGLGSPAVAQVSRWTGSVLIQGTQVQRSAVVPPTTIKPSLPRWGGGPPPPSPFDRPIPGIHSASLPRPGRDAFRAGPQTYAPRFSPDAPGHDGRRGRDGRRDGRHDNARGHDGRDGRQDGRRRHGRSNALVYPTLGAVYYGASPYYPAVYPTYPVAAPVPQVSAPTVRDEPEGFLRLLITPRDAGVFIDGTYAGTVDDFGGTGERALPAGLHSVRIEADAFEAVEFDVRVPANDTMTLRRDLEPRRSSPPPPLPPPQAAAPPSAPKTIYVIPRCYLGDSRPQQSQLPAGCSLADLRTLN
jgi:hypothetical protein